MATKILVTGATGNIASLVIPQLLAKGLSVRALVRTPSKAGALMQAGVEVVEGTFDDQAALDRAAAGMDIVLSITPAGEGSVSQGKAVTAAAKKAGVTRILRLSAIGAAADAPTDNGRQHIQIDNDIIASGISYTILRPHFFMQNIFGMAGGIKQAGSIYMGMGQGKLGQIDVRDIADCFVSLAVDGGHDNKIYTPTGPKSLDYNEVAAIISKSLGKPVTYVAVPIEEVGKSIRAMGWGEWGAQVMMDYSKAYASGWGDFVNDDVKTVTGHAPRSYEQFVNEVFVHAVR